MKRRLLSLIAVGSLLTPAAAPSEEARLIQFRMQPGESANYVLQVETRTEITWHRPQGPETRTVHFQSEMKVLIRCAGVTPEGVMQIEIFYPDFRLETTVNEVGQRSRIVSDKAGARSYVNDKLHETATWEQLEARGNQNLPKLLATLIEFSLDTRGRVLDVKVPAPLAGQFSETAIKQFFRQQVILPGVPIAPGAEWSDKTEQTVAAGPSFMTGKTMIDETTYTYEKNETVSGRECARIAITVTSQPKQEIPDMKEFKQSSEGGALLALGNGQLVESQMKLSQVILGTPGGVRAESRTTGHVKTSLLPPPERPSGSEKETATPETRGVR
jgi:hypothetical protein